MGNKLMTVEEAWVKFRDTTVPKDASVVQLEETKTAFYAGVYSMLNLQLAIDDKIPEMEQQEIIYGWYS